MGGEGGGREPAGEAAPARPTVNPALTRFPRHLLSVCVEAKYQPTNQPISWEFPGSPASRTWRFHRRGPGCAPWLGS